ncbi:MAG: hypothetical protein ACE5KG_03650 [Nitrososphaerales archaeon]
MPQHLVNAVLAWFHIISTVGWMGTAMFVVMVMTPTLLKLSPPTRGELILNLFPRMIKYVAVFATATIVFGALLALTTVGGNLAAFAPSNPWGLRISVGAALTLVAFILAIGIAIPTLRRIIVVVEGMKQNPKDQPPPEMPSLQNRLKLSSLSILILLSLILVFMVAAARF